GVNGMVCDFPPSILSFESSTAVRIQLLRCGVGILQRSDYPTSHSTAPQKTPIIF
ncbi:hypothetical protein J6590_088890, partial [Homalodisca vitripennis]